MVQITDIYRFTELLNVRIEPKHDEELNIRKLLHFRISEMIRYPYH